MVVGWRLWLWAACRPQWCNWLRAATSLPSVYSHFYYMACPSCFNVLSLSKESLLLLWLSQRDLFSLISPSRSVFVFKSFLSFFFSIPLLCSRASRVRVVGSSPLCPRNADRRVVCGWGLRMLFLSLLLFVEAFLIWRSFTKYLVFSATFSSHLSSLWSLFLFLSPLAVIFTPDCCVLPLYGAALCFSHFSHLSNGTELAQVPRSKQVYNWGTSQTNLFALILEIFGITCDTEESTC